VGWRSTYFETSRWSVRCLIVALRSFYGQGQPETIWLALDGGIETFRIARARANYCRRVGSSEFQLRAMPVPSPPNPLDAGPALIDTPRILWQWQSKKINGLRRLIYKCLFKKRDHNKRPRGALPLCPFRIV